MTISVGFFGKLPAHGDFVRRGLPAAVTALLDDWLQAEFARADDPAATIAALEPMRFASTAVAVDQLALGAIVSSSDRIGRTYVLVAVRLAPNPTGALPVPMPADWDDWCGRAEALLIAARDGEWLADATQAALETSARATVAALVPSALFVVPDDPVPATIGWRPSLNGRHDIGQTDGLPLGEAFDRLFGQLGVDP